MLSFEHENDLFQDEKDDTRAPFDEYTLYEIETDRRVSVITEFKYNISKEAEFCGIYSLSAYIILRAFMDSDNIIINYNYQLSKEQLSMFKSVYFEIYNTHPEDNYLNKVALNISNKIYV